MDKIFKKLNTETIEEYERRISALMDDDDYDLNWTKVALIINSQTGNDYSSDRYRKKYRAYMKEQDTNSAPKTVSVEYSAANVCQTEEEVIAAAIESDEDGDDYTFVNYEYTPFNKETISINFEKNETTSSKELPLTPEQLKDSNELLKAHGYDPENWEIRTATNNKTTRRTPNGDSYVYASRITIKPKKSVISDIEKIADYLETFKAPKLPIPKVRTKSEETLLIPLYDFHWGRLEEKDSEYKGFNVEEEKARIIEHIAKYVEKFKYRQFKKIYIVVGQDFFNSSFTNFTSSQSHLQSNALEFKAMFKSGCELLISIIDMFTDMGNSIEVVGSVGNHSWSEEIAAFYLLEAYYRNADNIKVDAEGSVRKYLEIGNSCVGLAHADKEGKRLYGLMQVEAKDIWARTKSHIFITGHLHHFNVVNENGIEVYRVPSICYHDKWTIDNGYTANEPKTMCFVFDEADGLIETHFMYL